VRSYTAPLIAPLVATYQEIRRLAQVGFAGWKFIPPAGSAGDVQPHRGREFAGAAYKE
jgi:hypothetical protein